MRIIACILASCAALAGGCRIPEGVRVASRSNQPYLPSYYTPATTTQTVYAPAPLPPLICDPPTVMIIDSGPPHCAWNCPNGWFSTEHHICVKGD